MEDDALLLRRFADARDERAFAEIVRRRIDFVYSAALRQVNGDAHLAEDVVQTVFADLAVKASRVARHRVLAGWLFVSTRFAAAKLVRGEQRRRAREREAQLMELNRTESGGDDWEKMRPVLDEALADLNEADRTAILLRFFEGRGLAEVGERLELSENTARMRVERALDKLHALLARRGVTSATGALAAALANQAVTAAPAGLAAAATQAGLAAGAAGGAIGAGIIMGMTKLQVAVCGCVLVAGAGGLTWEVRARAVLAAEADALRREMSGAEVLRAENARLARQAATVRAARTGNGAALAQLGDEAAALQQRLAAEQRAATARGVATSGAGARMPRAVFDPAEIELKPAATYRFPPDYPVEQRKAGTEGKAVIEFIVNEAGEVVDAKAVEATNEAFGKSAAAALLKWKFEPGRKGGVPVGVRMRQPITFTMAKGPAQTPTFWF